MNKSKYKIYNGRALKEFIVNTRIIILIIMFCIGIICGALILKSDINFSDGISDIFNSYSELRKQNGILNNFLYSIKMNGLLIIVSMFLGFSVIGCPFITLVPLMKGLAIGAVSGYLYSMYKLSGVGYSILMIYPGSIVSSYALLKSCNDSFEYSRNLYYKAIKGRGQYEKDETRIYLLRQLVLLGICMISSMIDVVTSELFSGLFEI